MLRNFRFAVRRYPTLRENVPRRQCAERVGQGAKQLVRLNREVQPPGSFFSQSADADYVEAAFKVGASAYVGKRNLCSHLLLAIREVIANRTCISPSIPSFRSRAQPTYLIDPHLTKRHKEVFRGWSSRSDSYAAVKVQIKVVAFCHSAWIDLPMNSSCWASRSAHLRCFGKFEGPDLFQISGSLQREMLAHKADLISNIRACEYSSSKMIIR